MTHDEWMVLVMTSHKGMYKKGYLGREVYEFEIEAAMKAQRAFARSTGTAALRITGVHFTTPQDGATYRTMTEACHKKMLKEPDLMESAWVNVWHTVVEASFLAHFASVSEDNVDMSDAVCDTGFDAYLAYCRECRDWTPDPVQYDKLPLVERTAWGVAQVVGARMMADGFRRMKNEKTLTDREYARYKILLESKTIRFSNAKGDAIRELNRLVKKGWASFKRGHDGDYWIANPGYSHLSKHNKVAKPSKDNGGWCNDCGHYHSEWPH